MAIEYFKIQFNLALFIFIFSFWLYIYIAKKKAGSASNWRVGRRTMSPILSHNWHVLHGDSFQMFGRIVAFF